MSQSELFGAVTRRDALKTLGAGAALLGLGLWSAPRAGAAPGAMDSAPFSLPPLGYAYDALEPHIDARTMEIHHGKHHQAYITNANKALEGHPELAKLGADELLAKLDQAPEAVRTALRNNVGGHVNHTFFWEVIKPGGPAKPPRDLVTAIERDLGSLDAFKAQFADAAAKRFGSGWAWLVVEKGKLAVRSTANQDSPMMAGEIPVLGIDVWEHAYYLKYQNKRADYVTAFWNVVNWDVADGFYAKARKA